MGSFLMGSLRQVLANLRGRAKALGMTVPKSRKKGLSYKYANYPFRNYPLTSARLLGPKSQQIRSNVSGN